MTEIITFDQLPKEVTMLRKDISELKELILAQKDQGQSPPIIQWLDINELVEYDPAKRKKATFYKLTSKKAIPHYKDGKHLVFLKSEIDDWLKNGKRKSYDEIEAKAEDYLSNNKKG